MKVLLLKDVKKVGRKDDVVTVADGYAQNVLLPQKLGVPATPEHLARLKKQEVRVADKKAFNETLLIKNISELGGKKIVLEARANDAGTLFQTIHKKQIVEAIERQQKVALPESVLVVDDIKKKGKYHMELVYGTIKKSLDVEIV